ncbi:3829_t:CDS:1, partial [Cetraspora pellucida]
KKYNLKDELGSLITHLSIDGFLSANKYIHIENNEIEGGITDEKILKTVTNKNKEENESVNSKVIELEKVNSNEAEKAINIVLRFLLKQKAEFGEVKDK